MLTIGGLDLIGLIPLLMAGATPILFAALGELVVERAGVLNLGVEGMMIAGAVTGFAVAVGTGSPWLGFVGAALGAALLALVFGVLTQLLLSNQVATGLGLTLAGVGLAALIGQQYVGVRAPTVSDLWLPGLRDIPVLGPVLFRHDAIVYLGLFSVLGIWYFLTRTRTGRTLRAVGENDAAAHALGYPVVAIRMAAIAFGGAMAGIGGAYLSLVRVPQWTEGVTAGAGWIALAIVVFSSWRAGRLLVGAYLFGGITVLQLNLQAAGAQVPVELLSMSPYLATILALVLLSAFSARSAAPGSLGKTFHASR